MRYTHYVLFLIGFSFASYSQTDSLKKKNNHWYVTWGYTRAMYSKSNIHLKNLSNDYNPVTGRYDYYDFTVYGAVAHDRPDFHRIGDIVNITIPQYVFRIGYNYNEKWGIELNFDHTKYVVDEYQDVHIVGQFNDHQVDNDTILDPTTLLHFEHTDGANFWMFNYVRNFGLLNKEKLNVSWVVKPGGGMVIPRTDVTLFGQRLNNNWKVAGWILGVETGLRMKFLRHGMFELVGKGTFANYVNVFVLGKGHGRANHHFLTGQLTATLGYAF